MFAIMYDHTNSSRNISDIVFYFIYLFIYLFIHNCVNGRHHFEYLISYFTIVKHK